MKARAKTVWSPKNNKAKEGVAREKKAPRAQRNAVERTPQAADFTSRSFEQLAAAQGVKPLSDPRRLIGGWPQDDDLDEFLEEVYRTRSM